MDRIWAPWRIQFILGQKPGPEQKKGCIFCEKPKENRDAENFILERGKKCFTLLNLYPYNSGHLMVVPYLHTASLEDLDPETHGEMMETVSRMTAMMRNVLQPHGFNVGMNLGAVAGAGIKDHLHMHVVPRWTGDVNFMPVLDDTRIINEHIEETYRRMMEGLGK